MDVVATLLRLREALNAPRVVTEVPWRGPVLDDHDRVAELGQGRRFVPDGEVERGRLGQGLGAGDGLDGFHAVTLGRGGRGASAPFTLGKRGGLRTLG